VDDCSNEQYLWKKGQPCLPSELFNFLNNYSGGGDRITGTIDSSSLLTFAYISKLFWLSVVEYGLVTYARISSCLLNIKRIYWYANKNTDVLDFAYILVALYCGLQHNDKR